MKAFFLSVMIALLMPSKLFAQGAAAAAYLEYIKLVQQLKEIQEVTKIIGSMKNMIDETNDAHIAQIFAETGTIDLNGQRVLLKDKISELTSTIKEAEAIASNLKHVDASFRELIGSKYEVTFNEKGQMENFTERYEQWSKSSKSVLERVLGNVAENTENFKSERTMLESLTNMSRSTDGRMKALEVANELSLAYTGQLQNLRDLVQSQMQMQSAMLQKAQDKKDLQKAMGQHLRRRAPTVVVGDGEKL